MKKLLLIMYLFFFSSCHSTFKQQTYQNERISVNIISMFPIENPEKTEGILMSVNQSKITNSSLSIARIFHQSEQANLWLVSDSVVIYQDSILLYQKMISDSANSFEFQKKYKEFYYKSIQNNRIFKKKFKLQLNTNNRKDAVFVYRKQQYHISYNHLRNAEDFFRKGSFWFDCLIENRTYTFYGNLLESKLFQNLNSQLTLDLQKTPYLLWKNDTLHCQPISQFQHPLATKRGFQMQIFLLKFQQKTIGSAILYRI